MKDLGVRFGSGKVVKEASMGGWSMKAFRIITVMLIVDSKNRN